jgi:hypothetical protein
MKRCCLHIGMHKTGSTAIQKSLAAVVRPKDWHLITLESRSNMGMALYAMFHPEPHKYHWFSKLGKTPQEVEEEGARLRENLRETIKKRREKNIIISAEVLSIFNRAGVAALAEFLKPLFDEVRVIGYVRPPASFRNSMFQQHVKHGLGKFEIKTKPNYKQRFENYDDIFGRSNVSLIKFKPANFPNQCVIADFSNRVGINFPQSLPILRTNESLTREACGILYAYRKFGAGYGIGKNVIRENSIIITTLYALKGDKFKFSRSTIDNLLSLDQEDTFWMEERLGSSLAETTKDDRAAISSENDLLTIDQRFCKEFALRFKEIWGIGLPEELLPKENPVDPVNVAKFIEHYRELCPKIILLEQEAKREAIAQRQKLKRSFSYRARNFPSVTIRCLKRFFGYYLF